VKTNEDYLRLAQWAYTQYQNQPTNIFKGSMARQYAEILALNLDVSFDEARAMAKNPEAKLPKGKD